MASLNQNSENLFKVAERLMPGGVNSPVRSFNAVGGTPVFISRAQGSRVWDVDGNAYIDYMASWGPLILGHADPEVVDAVRKAAAMGTSYGAPCEAEVELATIVTEAFPSVDVVRMTSSGTEATMSAVRLARACTDRDLIVKFEGCYHGHADYLLVKAGSGATTFGQPSSPGVPKVFADCTLLAKYNDLGSVEKLFDELGEKIACVILEPVAGNMGVVAPTDGFLRGLRDITRSSGALLVFDEVITGFRLSPGGAQELYGVAPDITCLGKIIGGGLPVGAYGASREIMSMVAPAGPMYQAGTLSGNPLAMAAGIATLRKLHNPGSYEKLEDLASQLVDGLRDIIKSAGVSATVNRVGSMFTLFFTDRSVVDYDAALNSDTNLFSRFFGRLLENGIMFPPSQFESVFVSLSHTESEISSTLDVMKKALE
ncbi:MAG: glutamate-1-semialdehyde 2,1-aminomutase [Thermodesulfobacteriota bacterium]